MRFLLVGGLGFLGQYLARALRERYPQASLRFLATTPRACPVFDPALDSSSEVRWNTDMTRPDTLAGAFDGAEVVFLLAGVVSFSLRDKDKLYRVNGEGVAAVLEACSQAGVSRLIHVSSCAALGYLDHPERSVDEGFEFDWELARQAEKHYMLSKRRGTDLVRAWRQPGQHAVIVYPGLLFGPGETHSAAPLIRALQQRRVPFTLPGGTNVVDVRDVAAALVKVVERRVLDDDVLLTGANLSFAAINRTIADLVGVDPPRFTLPRVLRNLVSSLFFSLERWFPGLELTGDNVHSAFLHRYFDNRHAAKVLDWSPQVSFRQSVVDTWQAMNK